MSSENGRKMRNRLFGTISSTTELHCGITNERFGVQRSTSTSQRRHNNSWFGYWNTIQSSGNNSKSSCLWSSAHCWGSWNTSAYLLHFSMDANRWISTSIGTNASECNLQAIVSYSGFNNLVGHQGIHKWFQEEIKFAPYCLLQHIPWIYISLTYWIHVEPSTYAKAKRLGPSSRCCGILLLKSWNKVSTTTGAITVASTGDQANILVLVACLLMMRRKSLLPFWMH